MKTYLLAMRARPFSLAVAGCAASVALISCGGNTDNETSGPSPAQLAATCGSLAGQTLGGVTVTSAKRVEAIANVTTSGFCQVRGTRAPFLDIEVDVPDNWSGRYWQNGGGGFNGTIPSAVTADSTGAITAVHPALALKNAVYAASNGGNRANVPSQAGPGLWFDGTAAGQISANDYAYQSIGTTLGFAKSVIKTFYGKAASYRYFNGCSNGGREAYIAAQRWPGDFDGIVSGCETEDMTGQTAMWLAVGSAAGTPAAPSAAQYKAAYAAAVASCDAQDGLTDGYLTNAASCRFDPGLLQCGLSTANADPNLCLTAPQIQTFRKLFDGLKLSDGTVVYSGFNWSDFSTFGGAFGALGGAFGALATNDPSWMTPAKQATFNVDEHYPFINAGLIRIGAENDLPAIASFVASGKKLISWHDNGDNLLSANEHARNDAKLSRLVKAAGLADPTTAMRLFLVPTNNHAAGQDVTKIDWPSAIIGWVESGRAPTQLTYTFTPPGAAAARSLPVCLYPAAPKYNGAGAIGAAASYSCV